MKRKRFMVLVPWLLAAVFLMSCAQSPGAITPGTGEEPSAEGPIGGTTEEEPEDDTVETSADGKIVTRHSDLDGDGEKETIVLTTGKSTGFGYDDYTEYSIEVGDRLYALRAFTESIEPRFNVVNITRSDGFKEIAVSEYGPSSDFFTTFYHFDGDLLTNIGVVSGFYGEASEMCEVFGTVKIDGSGTITGLSRGNLLHTWFHESTYQMNADFTIVEVPKDLYVMDAEVTAIHELTLVKSPDDPAEAFTLRPGESVIIRETDDREWCSVVNSKGETGWFAVDSFDVVRNTGMHANEVFDGLNYAD